MHGWTLHDFWSMVISSVSPFWIVRWHALSATMRRQWSVWIICAACVLMCIPVEAPCQSACMTTRDQSTLANYQFECNTTKYWSPNPSHRYPHQNIPHQWGRLSVLHLSWIELLKSTTSSTWTLYISWSVTIEGRSWHLLLTSADPIKVNESGGFEDFKVILRTSKLWPLDIPAVMARFLW